MQWERKWGSRPCQSWTFFLLQWDARPSPPSQATAQITAFPIHALPGSLSGCAPPHVLAKVATRAGRLWVLLIADMNMCEPCTVSVTMTPYSTPPGTLSTASSSQSSEPKGRFPVTWEVGPLGHFFMESVRESVATSPGSWLLAFLIVELEAYISASRRILTTKAFYCMWHPESVVRLKDVMNQCYPDSLKIPFELIVSFGNSICFSLS